MAANNLLYYHPDDIHVQKDRQRQTFNEESLKELAESIKRIGLIQPLVVELRADGAVDLIAGERRLRAMRMILSQPNGADVAFADEAPRGKIPCLERRQLPPDLRYEIELEENLQREDLTWQEKATAIAKLHDFRKEHAAEPQTLVKTAEAVRTSPATVSSALLVAKHLANPEVAKAATLKEAEKVIRKQAETAHRAELAKKFDLTKTPHTLIRGDAVDELRKLEANSIDHICTDGPYGIGAQSFGDQAGTGHAYDDSKEYVWGKLMPVVTEEWYRVCKPSSAVFAFCAFERFELFSELMGLAGFYVWPRPLIWNKMGNGMLPVPEVGPRYSYECILFAYREQFRVVKGAMPDVLTYPPVKQLVHGAEKPAALLADLLSRSALPGQKILDSFAGSGSIFLACNTNRLVATAFEISEESYNIALPRMSLNVKDEPIDQAPDIEL